MIQSTESSNRIEGIVVHPLRLRDLIEEKTTPRDRSENEVAAYRYVLSLIHSNARDIPMRPNYIKQLGTQVTRFQPNRHGEKFEVEKSMTCSNK